ncbi:MAG: hypothetical protein E7388_07195 [Ruminococcaceae bacterium]|nr:hypothetical protein [Oscillospiraceae bacterium]
MSSIYETIFENPSAKLPDQTNTEWCPGAYEGTILRGSSILKQHSYTNYKIARLVKKFILNPSSENMQQVENSFRKYTAISVIDYVLSHMSRMKLPAELLHNGAIKLTTESAHRDTVKFGIALLGDERSRIKSLIQQDAEIVRKLSLNEEFTLYGLVALKNILPKDQATEILLDLGEQLTGWGKLALMYELDYTNPYVRLWTLKNGCRNSIGLSYLANVCAIKGKLKNYLQELEDNELPMDPEYLPGICKIFLGLLEDHPENDGIYEYPDAVESANLFRAIVERSPAEIKDKAADVISKLNAKGIGKS